MNCYLSIAILVAAASVAVEGSGIIAGTSVVHHADTPAVVSGPSGTIVRSGATVAVPAPAVPALAVPAIARTSYVAPPLVHGAVAASPIVYGGATYGRLGYSGYGYGLGVPAGSGIEGQWVPDISEKLYDDGSYKPYVYAV